MKPSLAKRCIAAGLVATAMCLSPALAQDDGLLGARVASVTIGPYFRAELGSAAPSLDNGYWHPPGFDPTPGVGDPEVRFALDGDTAAMGTVAFGYDWQGWRGDLSFTHFGLSTFSGPCSSASNGSSCAIHADIDAGSVQTTSVLANVFYAPFEARGSQSVFQPFIVAGLGFAHNEVGNWTRSNPAASRPFRTFEGASKTSLAWSVGIGASYQVTRPGRWPVLVEASWRYYDLGSASGGARPLAGNGTSEPVQPLTFDNRQSVIAVGVRIPLERF